MCVGVYFFYLSGDVLRMVGVGIILFGILFIAVVGAMSRLPSDVVMLNADEIRFVARGNIFSVGWDQLLGIEMYENLSEEDAVLGRPPVRNYLMHVIGHPPVAFSSRWSNGDRVAASLLTAHFDLQSVLDRSSFSLQSTKSSLTDRSTAISLAIHMAIPFLKLQRWLNVLSAELRVQDAEATVDPHTFVATKSGKSYPLVGLLRATIAKPETQWISELQSYVVRREQLQDEFELLLKTDASQQQIRSNILLQIHPRFGVQSSEIFEHLGEDLAVVLVMPLEHGELIVDSSALPSIHGSREELRRRAIANLKANIVPRSLDDGMFLFEGDNFCAARILALEQFPALGIDAHLGAICSIRSRQYMLVLPITHFDTVAQLLDGSFLQKSQTHIPAEGSSLSEALYWYKPGAVISLTYTGSPEGNEQLVLPDALSEALLNQSVSRS